VPTDHAVDASFVYDPFAPEVMADPHPFYAVLRDRFPVYYAAKYDTFFLSRFQDALDFLSITGNVFVANEGTNMERDVLLRHNLAAVPELPLTPLGNHLNYGSPTYEQVRQAHGRPLRPGAVRELTDFVRATVAERLDVLLARGTFDLVHEFGGFVSASTICHLFRMPPEITMTLLECVNEATRKTVDASTASRNAARVALVDMIREVIAERRAEGPDGTWMLVDPMFALEVDGRLLSDSEIALNLTCVLVGGTETLPKVIGHGLMELWRHPDQLAAVRADLPANVPAALEEMFRFCGPAQWFGRTVARPITIAGQDMKPGQRVAWLAQSAARDEREFTAPDEFHWDRKIKRTLAFGYGQHFCVGIHLARLEGRIMLEEFLSRAGAYTVDVDRAVREPSSFQWGYGVVPAEVTGVAS
jgi:cytochrome P450